MADSRAAGRRRGRLQLLTGEGGSGKTTWCREFVERVRRAGEGVDGVVCPAVFADGEKVAIDVVTLGDGVRQRLASRISEDVRAPGELGWRFDSAVMEQVDRYLDTLHGERRILIDEVGPLELLRGEGWQGALRLVDDGSYDEAVVVVRPALIGIARQRWPWAQIVTVAEGGPAPP